MNKYHARKCLCTCGHTHDSQKEAERCFELNILCGIGKIKSLQIQRKFVLIPPHKYKQYDMPNEREVSYIADFTYIEDGKLVVEDTKGYKTKDYIIKRKLFKEKYCQNGDTIFKEI